MKIINNFDDFLNEEEEFDLYEEFETDLDDTDFDDSDIYDELDSELDEEFGFDFEDDFDSLDEDAAPVASTPTTKGGKPMAKKDPHHKDKIKYQANLAPKLIMTFGTPKINSVLNAPMPGNIGYKKGLKNRSFVPSMAISFLKMVSMANPGKMDKPAFQKVMKNLMDLHRVGVTGKK